MQPKKSSTGQRRRTAGRTPYRFPLWPAAKDPSVPVSHNTLYSFIWRQRDRGVIPVVTNRDLRRTWKTLAGKGGLTKEIATASRTRRCMMSARRTTTGGANMPEKRWYEKVGQVRHSLQQGAERQSGLTPCSSLSFTRRMAAERLISVVQNAGHRSRNRAFAGGKVTGIQPSPLEESAGASPLPAGHQIFAAERRCFSSTYRR